MQDQEFLRIDKNENIDQEKDNWVFDTNQDC